MLKINIDGEEYKINWQYSWKYKGYIANNGLAYNRKVFSSTQCKIYDTQTRDIIGWGETKCNKLDRFDPDIGRRISLTRALTMAGMSHQQRKEAMRQYEQR